MKFIEVYLSRNSPLIKEPKKICININHIIYFEQFHCIDGKIDHEKTVLQLIGSDDILVIKYNYYNFKDNILKLHSNHTHIV
jgi:hypothetical protein